MELLTKLYIFKVTHVHSELAGLTAPYTVGYVGVATQDAVAALELADKLYPSTADTFKTVVRFVGIEEDVNAINQYLIQQA
mgnify:CR=1 FL=1